MDVYEKIEDAFEATKSGIVIFIGNSDGVHIGHKKLLDELIKKAMALNVSSIVITFDPHPLKVLAGKCPPVITPIKQKLELL